MSGESPAVVADTAAASVRYSAYSGDSRRHDAMSHASACSGAESVASTSSQSTFIEKLKRLLGYGAECENGGVRLVNGTCRCPANYIGKLCETIQCLVSARAHR